MGNEYRGIAMGNACQEDQDFHFCRIDQTKPLMSLVKNVCYDPTQQI